MKITKNNSCPNQFLDRIEKNRKRQKNMYDNYTLKSNTLHFSVNKMKDRNKNNQTLKNKSNTNLKIKNQDLFNKSLNTKTLTLNKNNNLVTIYPNIIFEKVTSSHNKLTKEDIKNFEKNEQIILNSLFKGIEQLNNKEFIINVSQVFHNQKYKKGKQSITTKESETENNNNISKSSNTYRTNSKKNSKEKSFQKNLNEINTTKGKKIIKIEFPKNDYFQNNNLTKNSPIRLKYYKEMNFNQNNDIEKPKINSFRNYHSKNIKNMMQDSDLLDISSIKSNVNCNNSISKNNVSVQNSLMNFIK
jgi:hypothetical protein